MITWMPSHQMMVWKNSGRDGVILLLPLYCGGTMWDGLLYIAIANENRYYAMKLNVHMEMYDVVERIFYFAEIRFESRGRSDHIHGLCRTAPKALLQRVIA